jgi:hypothetical protein
MQGPVAAPDPPRPQAGLLALTLGSLGVASVFLGAMLASTEGHFVPQVADLYLVCQYAKALAEGHPFQYNAGEPFSTGATSVLHTALLGVAHAVGIRGEGLVAFAILTGAAFYVASVRLAYRLAAILGGQRDGLLAGGLIALGGPVVWGFLYGSDIALVMLLCLWLLERMVTGWNEPQSLGVVLPAALLALSRPEGLVVAMVVGLAWSVGPWCGHRGWRRLWVWLPAALGLSVLLFYRALTGSWLGTSVADKSLFDSYGLIEGLALVCEYGVDVVRGLFLGFYPGQLPIGFARGWASLFFPPLGLVFLVVVVARPPAPFATPLRLWCGLVALLFALLTPNRFMGVHYHRYLMWAFPTLLVLMAVGWGRLARAAQRAGPGLDRALFAGGAAVFLGLGLLSTLRMASAYGGTAGDMYRRDVAAARWIARNLPRGVAMANIATSVEYLTGHRNLNLHGVTSPAFFGAHASEREAAAFEALGRLPASERPPFLITTQSVQESLATMKELVEGPPLFSTASFSDEILIHAMRYDMVGKNGRLFLPETQAAVAGRQEVDRLNVCDPLDERAHEYTFRSRQGHLRLHGTARLADYDLSGRHEPLIDGGRAILGGERFRIRARPGQDLFVVMRTASEIGASILRASGGGLYTVGFAEAGVALSVDGQEALRLTFPPRPGWEERVLRVPGALVGRERPEIALSGRYASFHFWFFQ